MARIGGFLMDMVHIARDHLFASLLDVWPELAIDIALILAIAVLILWRIGESRSRPPRLER